MAAFSLWGLDGVEPTTSANIDRLRSNPALCDEFIQLLEYRRDFLDTLPQSLVLPFECALELHAQYTRDEILAGLGFWTLEKQPTMREGVRHLPDIRTDVFLITLNKTEAGFSPTTMYADYAISDRLFHWQSQPSTSENTATGQRYVNHVERGGTVLLFVREDRSTNNLTNPFYFLGPADYVSHTGSKPMSIIWKLRYPMPAKLQRKTITLDAA
jgi:hypothetical protein